MTVALVRRALEDALEKVGEPHPGLLLQRGLTAAPEPGPDNAKVRHIRRVCATRTTDFYERAFERWKNATQDECRFRQLQLPLASRLFIGLAGGGMLETGCTVSHSYGMPYIPGSSIKGVVRAHARARLAGEGDERGESICNELFGTPSLAGLIHFHDAWWVPQSAISPFVEEVVTTHHTGYYGSEGREEATDFDSPVPNAQVAVHGAFLFVMEGAAAWLCLAEKMLADALCTRGIGAKTRAGYGYFGEAVPPSRETCPWVDEQINRLAPQDHAKDEALRGQPLARKWQALDDAALKQAALDDIRARWEERGWWDNPPGRASQRAKEVYGQASGRDNS